MSPSQERWIWPLAAASLYWFWALAQDPAEAGHRARATLLDDLQTIQDQYLRGWQNYQKTLLPLESATPGNAGLYRVSTAVMSVHDGKSLAGAIASLSTRGE